MRQTVKLIRKKESIFYSGLDSCIALTVAFFVNAAILIVSAAVFYERGLKNVAEIQDAYHCHASFYLERI